MRILLIINDLGRGGAQRVVCTLAHDLVTRLGYDVTILTLESSPVVYELPKGVKVKALNLANWQKGIGKALVLPLAAIQLRRAVRNTRPDHVVSFLVRANLTLALSALGLSDDYAVISERNTSDNQYGSSRIRDRVMRQFIRIFYNRARRIVAISEGVKESLVRLGVDSSKVVVIPNPQFLQSIEVEARLEPAVDVPDDGKFTVVTVGRMVPQKDQESLLKAIAHASGIADVRLIIIGDGPLRGDLEDRARRLGIEGRVTFAGWQRNPFAIMARCDAFVLSSKFEGFGNVLVEAMACGLPVISTDCPSGPREILQSGAAGILVPVGDPHAIANALVKLSESEEVRVYWRQRSLKRAADFDVSKITDRYLNVSRVNYRN